MISHNLKPLTRCGFVFVKRKGKERIYSVNRETMEPMFKIIDNHHEEILPKKWQLHGKLMRGEKNLVEK